MKKCVHLVDHSLSLSLSFTHTHTHTHTYISQFRECTDSLNVKKDCYHRLH